MNQSKILGLSYNLLRSFSHNDIGEIYLSFVVFFINYENEVAKGVNPYSDALVSKLEELDFLTLNQKLSLCSILTHKIMTGILQGLCVRSYISELAFLLKINLTKYSSAFDLSDKDYKLKVKEAIVDDFRK